MDNEIVGNFKLTNNEVNYLLSHLKQDKEIMEQNLEEVNRSIFKLEKQIEINKNTEF